MDLGKNKEDFTERKYFTAELKALEDRSTKDLGVFSGHANTKDLDETDDIVEAGSFKKTLQEHGDKRALFFMHGTREIGNLMGAAVNLKEDGTGLFTEGEMMLEFTEVRKAFEAIKKGIIDRMSIGFSVVKAAYEEIDKNIFIRKIKELKLFEISLIPVGMAANNQSLITDFKSNEMFQFIKQGNGSKEFKRHILSLLFPGVEPDLAFTTLEKMQEPGASTPPDEEPKGFYTILAENLERR